jgi:tetratricopeptide (TPR) repeat protein
LTLRRRLAGLLLGAAILANPNARGQSADPVAPLDLAIAAGEASLTKGDLAEAERSYRIAVFQGWLLKGTLEGLDKRLPEAREALRQATTYLPDDPVARRSLAMALLQTGQAAPAVALIEPATRGNPRDVEGHRLLAKGLAALGRYDEAGAVLDEARAATDDPEALFLLGTEYLGMKRPETAAELFAQVLEARPIPQTHVLIGRAYRDAGELDRAATELRAALAQDPGVRRAHYYLGMVAMADVSKGPGRLVKAVAEFQEELKLEPEDPLASDQLGAALMEAERPAEALPFFETAVRVDPRSAYVGHLGGAQLALDRPAEAAQTLQRALDLSATQAAADSDVEKVHYQLGLALRKLGRTEEAAAQLAEARRLATAATQDPAGPAGSAAARLARLAAEASPLAGLSAEERAALLGKAARGLARAYLNLGVLRAQSSTPASSRERFTMAAELFASAAALDPDFPNVQLSLGVARFNARQFDKAVAPLERALAAKPDDLGLRSMLATSLLNTESWDRAADLLRGDPERETNPTLQSAYGLALVRGGRGVEAESILSGLVAERGDSAELRLLLGQALLVQGKAAEAVPQLEEAARLTPDDPRVRDELGRAYQKLGRADLAQHEIEAARRLRAGQPGGAP